MLCAITKIWKGNTYDDEDNDDDDGDDIVDVFDDVDDNTKIAMIYVDVNTSNSLYCQHYFFNIHT